MSETKKKQSLCRQRRRRQDIGDNRDAAADCKDEICRSQAWLTQTLERLANGWPSSEIHNLMPWSYKA